MRLRNVRKYCNVCGGVPENWGGKKYFLYCSVPGTMRNLCPTKFCIKIVSEKISLPARGSKFVMQRYNS